MGDSDASTTQLPCYDYSFTRAVHRWCRKYPLIMSWKSCKSNRIFWPLKVQSCKRWQGNYSKLAAEKRHVSTGVLEHEPPDCGNSTGPVRAHRSVQIMKCLITKENVISFSRPESKSICVLWGSVEIVQETRVSSWLADSWLIRNWMNEQKLYHWDWNCQMVLSQGYAVKRISTSSGT